MAVGDASSKIPETGHHDNKDCVKKAQPKNTFKMCIEKKSKKSASNGAAIRAMLASLPQKRSRPEDLNVPTEFVLNKFDWSCKLWACVSITTHQKPTATMVRNWHVGKAFGHRCLLDNAAVKEELRLITISWAIGTFVFDTGRATGWPRSVVRYVRPAGFEVSEDVHVDHNKRAASPQETLHALMSKNQRHLDTVLREMINDFRRVIRGKGRLSMHSLEYEARIISAELGRMGLLHEQQFWKDICRNGLCTMDPYLNQWIFDPENTILRPKAIGFTQLTTKVLGNNTLPRNAAAQRWLVTQQLHQQVQKHQHKQMQLSRAQPTAMKLPQLVIKELGGEAACRKRNRAANDYPEFQAKRARAATFNKTPEL